MREYALLPNKHFAFSCLERLKAENCLSDEIICILTSPEACHQLFCCSSGFPVLKEISSNLSKPEIASECYVNHHRRYYQNLFQIGGRFFIVTNHWYGPNKSMPDNRTPFFLWASSLLEMSMQTNR